MKVNHILWYKSATQKWDEGFPIGNGRLAAMVINESDCDRISLNHERLWRGENRYRDNPKMNAQQLADVRALLSERKFSEATRLANDYFGGSGGISGKKNRVDAYQPAGDLVFHPNCTEFTKRTLDLKTGVASSKRGELDTQAYVNCAYDCVIYAVSGPCFDGMLTYTRAEDKEAVTQTTYCQNGLIFDCSFNRGISYRTVVHIFSDGKITAEKNGIRIENATFLHTFTTIGTSVKGIEEELSTFVVPEAYHLDDLLQKHIDIFQTLQTRTQIFIDLPQSELPTDERIKAFRDGASDPELMLLYWNFGKYLLICSSVCGELPANLQGKWNDSLTPPWESDYHFDINLQMNYWAAEAVNMPECAEALLKFIESFVPHAQKAAKDLYGCNGVWFPIQTDAWGRATPESYGWAVWIGAAPWIAQHFWKHYEYNKDEQFLKNRAYPFFKEVAAFYEDYLQKDENQVYQILPSQSPENNFNNTDKFPVSICISSAMDVQLAYDALTYAIDSAKILNTDNEKVEKWQEIRDHLPPFSIGSDGRLLEWNEEFTETEPGHRHLSHIYGLYPGEIFTAENRASQYEAAKKSLRFRLAQGGGHTGWSRAWVACLFARMGEAENFWEHFSALVKDFATITLLDLHPPRIFQIDGNLGAVAAVAEALWGSYNGKTHLLSALPEEWAKGGRVCGAKIPGNHTLDFSWENGSITEFNVYKSSDEPITLVINGADKIL